MRPAGALPANFLHGNFGPAPYMLRMAAYGADILQDQFHAHMMPAGGVQCSAQVVPNQFFIHHISGKISRGGLVAHHISAAVQVLGKTLPVAPWAQW